MKYMGRNDSLDELFADLEFYSFLKKIPKKQVKLDVSFKELSDVHEINIEKCVSYYIECDKENYHLGKIIGMGVYDGDNLFYVSPEKVKEVCEYLKQAVTYTYDLKKNMVLLKDVNMISNFDHMIGAYLLNYQMKDDLAFMMNNDGIEAPFYSDILKDEEMLKKGVTLKAKYVYDTRDDIVKRLKMDDMFDLFTNVEMPLVRVLAKMELAGIRCDKDI